VIGGEKVGRYSFLAADPFMELAAYGTQVTVTDAGGSRTFHADDPLQELRNCCTRPRRRDCPSCRRSSGGAVGYAGYDVVRYAEHLPNAPLDDRGLPDLAFGFYDRMIVFDNVDKTMYVVVMAEIEPRRTPKRPTPRPAAASTKRWSSSSSRDAR
jgi:anthranilate synthase component I